MEVRDILESEEMRHVVEALTALRQKFSSHNHSEERLWPMAQVRNGPYKAEKILQIISDERDYYAGYKDVLAASFAGWLVLPRDREIREILMAQAVLTHMDRAELAVGNDGLTVEKDIAARYLFTGLDFLIEVFDCLGGYQAFRSGAAIDALIIAYDPVEKPINTAVRALVYLHHAVDRFGRPGFDFTPSLNKAVVIFDALKEPKRGFDFKQKYVSRSLLHDRWSKNKQTLAMLYAASTIKVNRRTLLYFLLDGSFSYHEHRKYIDLWMGRARFVASHIFSRMKDQDLQKRTRQLLGEGQAMSFAPPKLSGVENECFEEVFRNYIR
ncbi:hypothetical protein [Aliirhizobium smilacinae]|uniref:Uncharacterized protein n=1 Tax=Aliirhizobium smilacinae TaxID=1395944 RepID=A0A5C4XU94_9HYPH|nr:hypothetical protein [Rhizobium smilacinae]TNM66214.1 hypothetical protein FHP24_08415 [Rhizobium smilacinae]